MECKLQGSNLPITIIPAPSKQLFICRSHSTLIYIYCCVVMNDGVYVLPQLICQIGNCERSILTFTCILVPPLKAVLRLFVNTAALLRINSVEMAFFHSSHSLTILWSRRACVYCETLPFTVLISAFLFPVHPLDAPNRCRM